MIVDRSVEVLARRIPAENYLGGLSCTVYSHPLKQISMRNPYFRAKTLDDLLRYALQSIEKYGEPVRASKGRTSEVRGVVLELTNPRARLSRTESRGKIFSCIGELCWYLKGTNRTAFVAHYISAYRKSSEKGLVYGGYGPRLFKSWKGVQQFENLIGSIPTALTIFINNLRLVAIHPLLTTVAVFVAVTTSHTYAD